MKQHSVQDDSAVLVRLGGALGVGVAGFGLLVGSQLTVGVGLLVLTAATYAAIATGNRLV
ncbi:hypothetical protein [Botrimarina sp.]|uniref:hypothetical protein n=1 Tax=Botrimarina sp. TaxID=2795802 RepID=UPI0032ED6D3A